MPRLSAQLRIVRDVVCEHCAFLALLRPRSKIFTFTHVYSGTCTDSGTIRPINDWLHNKELRLPVAGQAAAAAVLLQDAGFLCHVFNGTVYLFHFNMLCGRINEWFGPSPSTAGAVRVSYLSGKGHTTPRQQDAVVPSHVFTAALLQYLVRVDMRVAGLPDNGFWNVCAKGWECMEDGDLLDGVFVGIPMAMLLEHLTVRELSGLRYTVGEAPPTAFDDPYFTTTVHWFRNTGGARACGQRTRHAAADTAVLQGRTHTTW